MLEYLENCNTELRLADIKIDGIHQTFRTSLIVHYSFMENIIPN